jgi:hypothetical protein
MPADDSRVHELETRQDQSDWNPSETILRCGWCGLRPLVLDIEVIGNTELCGACNRILGNVDWKSLIGVEGE